MFLDKIAFWTLEMWKTFLMQIEKQRTLNSVFDS